MARESTQSALAKSIERLGGEAATDPPSASATAAGQGGEGEADTPTPLPAVNTERNVWGEVVPVAPFEERLDVGWVVWRGRSFEEVDEAPDPKVRRYGVVVDAAGEDKVVVLCSRMRQRRIEAWLEVWPIDDLDRKNSYDGGPSKKVQAAKAACGAIYESKSSGRWGPQEEELLAAIATLTAHQAPERVA